MFTNRQNVLYKCYINICQELIKEEKNEQEVRKKARGYYNCLYYVTIYVKLA